VTATKGRRRTSFDRNWKVQVLERRRLEAEVLQLDVAAKEGYLKLPFI